MSWPEDQPPTPERFIELSGWTFAKTMPEIPHEYTVRDKTAPPDPWFDWMTLHIRKHGYRATFGWTTYTYLDVGSWKYWTMGAPLADTTIINRAEITHKDVRPI